MAMTIPPHVAPIHARHGSYAPRYGWLLKTHLALKSNPHVFAAGDTLGVGKSAVASMRFWSAAFKLSDETTHTPGTASDFVPTDRARRLLDEEGADPHLDDTGSLWLLHWWLLAPPCLMPAWYYTFCLSPWLRFERDHLRDGILRMSAATGWHPASAGAIRRDVDCLVRMYTPGRPSPDQPRATSDDLIDRPFSELGLMTTDEGRIHLHTMAGNAVPDDLPAYACLDYAARAHPGPGSISLGRLAQDPDGPGRVAQPRALRRALERTARRHPGLHLSDNGDGQDVLAFRDPPLALAWDILDHRYGDVRLRLGVRPEAMPNPESAPDAARAEQLPFWSTPGGPDDVPRTTPGTTAL